jgi:hypothetical protein
MARPDHTARRGAMKKSKGKLISYGATTKQLSEAGVTRIVMPATTKRDISDGYRLLLRECEQDHDNWKAKALAYRDIIKRAKATNNPFGCAYVEIILNEADKIKEGK